MNKKINYILVLLSSFTSILSHAHSTKIDMAYEALVAATQEYEMKNENASYYSIDAWYKEAELNVELVQIQPTLDATTYICEHHDESGHDGGHHTQVQCKITQTTTPENVPAKEYAKKDTHLNSIKTIIGYFKEASKNRPADELTQRFWNIRSYQKDGNTKVKVRSAIVNNAKEFRELTYVCTLSQCNKSAEEKIVPIKKL